MFERFNIQDKDIFKVCVIATMSSGKSTFMNAIIGEEVMPEKNEACTARTMAVLDHDNTTSKKAHIIRKDGSKEIVEITSREVMERINNDMDVVDFLIETDIQNIQNTSRALVLVDTPGVNNSGDEMHGKRTEEFLEKMDMGVIVYLLNATQLATNDDAALLQSVIAHVKQQNGKVKMLFVINKIDALDKETESIPGIVRIAKEYIQKHGIQNPNICPLSALAAKVLRMAYHKKEMTRREMRALEDAYEEYRPKDNNMTMYALLEGISDESYEIGGEEVSAQELQRAIENTGITIVEKRLESYMFELERRYVPEVVIKTDISERVGKKLQERLKELEKIPKGCKKTQFAELAEKIKNADYLQKMNIGLPSLESVAVLIEPTEGLPQNSGQIEELVQNMEQVKEKMFQQFSQGKYMAVRHMPGMYWMPEKEGQERASLREYFLMSVDRRQWSGIAFGKISKLIDQGTDFYLLNEYCPFVFRVSGENSSDVISMLDYKLPIGIIKAAGLPEEDISLDGMNAYLGQLKEEDNRKKKEVREAQEQLERTYKGVLFETKEKKEHAIAVEKEIADYCDALEGRCYAEVLAKKESVGLMPRVIFQPYLAKMAVYADLREKTEEEGYLGRIALSGQEELPKLQEEIKAQNYSDDTQTTLRKAIQQRMLTCQREELERETGNLDGMGRDKLKELLLVVKSKSFDDVLTEQYMGRIEGQIDLEEKRELQKLCSGLDEMSLQELQDVQQEIESRGYKQKHAFAYIGQIQLRADLLHRRNLEQYCQEAENAGQEELAVIQKKVEDEACGQELKEKCYEAIANRKEQLEYKELSALTSHLELKSLQDLEGLNERLANNGYNEKFIRVFQQKVRVALESAQQLAANGLVKNIQCLGRQEAKGIRDNILAEGYPPRVSKRALELLDARIFALDMQELMEIENQFDTLSLERVGQLRNMVKLKNVSEQSKEAYLRKLREREKAIGYQKISQNAAFAHQLCQKHGIVNQGIQIALFSQGYDGYIEGFQKERGQSGFADLPIFLFPNEPFLAVTQAEVHYKEKRVIKKIRLSEIASFAMERSMFHGSLVIHLRNGINTVILGKFDKKACQPLESFLNEFLMHGSNPAILNQFQPIQVPVKGFEADMFAVAQVSKEPAIQRIRQIFLHGYAKLEYKYGKADSVKCALQEDWEASKAKAMSMFGIAEGNPVFWYYGQMMLTGMTAKGIAVGEGFFYLKRSGEKTDAIPIAEIFEIKATLNGIEIITTSHKVISAELPLAYSKMKEEVAHLLDEYAKGIQLINLTGIRRNVCVGMEEGQVGNGGYCTNCQAALQVGAKSCGTCGKEVGEAEAGYRFCKKCGNRIKKSANFCTRCGAKIS